MKVMMALTFSARAIGSSWSTGNSSKCVKAHRVLERNIENKQTKKILSQVAEHHFHQNTLFTIA